MHPFTYVHVRDYEGSDDAERIRAAIQHATRIRADFVVFEARRYRLSSTVQFMTEGFEHDAGSASHNSKECHIVVQHTHRLTLLGALDEAGNPATILAGHNDNEVHGYLPAILWCEDNDELSIQNISFVREPAYASAGVVVNKDDSTVWVQVFEDNPCYDGMGCYCMNRFDPESGALLGESVTYGQGAGSLWKLEVPGLLSLSSEDVAAKVNVGEHVSWHQGAQTDFQTYFARCDGLRLTNIRTMNANGFAMLTEACKDITAERIMIKPDGNLLFTAPRDAWKIFKCSGHIRIDRMEIEGVRMDGQNMHSNWLRLEQVAGSHEALFYCPHTFAELVVGSTVELHEEEDIYTLQITDWHHEGKQNRGHLYRIRFDRPLPLTAKPGMLGNASCWEPDGYWCTNSSFMNIAGAGHLVRYDHVHIMNCTYRNTMNPGILLGAELPTHMEGGHATDIVIKDCEFDNCGFFPRYEASGCIGIKSAGFSGKYNKNILIMNNRMSNSAIGVHAIDAHHVYLIDNAFHNIEAPILQDKAVDGLLWQCSNRI